MHACRAMLKLVVARSADVQRCAFALLSVLLEQDSRSPTFLHTLHLGPVLLGPCFFQHSMLEETTASAASHSALLVAPGLFESFPLEDPSGEHEFGEGVSGSVGVGAGASGVLNSSFVVTADQTVRMHLFEISSLRFNLNSCGANLSWRVSKNS
jgi:hypothetical protein